MKKIMLLLVFAVSLGLQMHAQRTITDTTLYSMPKGRYIVQLTFPIGKIIIPEI